MAEDNPEDASDGPSPLDELRRSIEEQAPQEGRVSEIWEALEGRFNEKAVGSGGVASEDVNQPVGEASRSSPASQTTPSMAETDRRWFPTYPSRSVYVIHGVLTTLIFILSFGIYGGAVLALIPRHLWILSLPLFALGVFFVTPILAWSLGFWNPSESI